jgi:ribose 5-phosphate isomerase A
MTDPGIRAAAGVALDLVHHGARVGLGSGRAAAMFVIALGARVRAGLRVTGIATSSDTANLAREAGIPLVELGEGVQLDLTVDGADEVAPNLDLVKGRGAALVRERIVAAASKRQVILVGSDKLVRRLGERCPIPIEVIPFAAEQVAGRIKELNLVPTLRIDATVRRVITENGNVILDCAVREPLPDGAAARALESAVLSIPGVVDTGLFLGTAERVLVGYADGHVETLSHTGS